MGRNSLFVSSGFKFSSPSGRTAALLVVYQEIKKLHEDDKFPDLDFLSYWAEIQFHSQLQPLLVGGEGPINCRPGQ